MGPVKTWRLHKTLSRKLEFRPIEAVDMPYIWAAYRAGGLNDFPEGLTADAFKTQFETFVIERYDAAWTLFAESRKGFVPVGLMLGFWPHHETMQFMIANLFMWFPWASNRNRIESAVNFFNTIRNEIPMVGFVKQHDKKFFETIARHGIVRRVGTSQNIFNNGPASVWETR